MIPLKLLLHNFLSYRDCTIDFTQLHIAAIAGANGHGKSALLDGVTWALWGRCRAATDDDAIFLAQSEMLVDLEFAVDADRFAVNRKKTRGKTAQLQLFKIDDSGARIPMTGSVMRETQANVNRTLGLDHTTFRNSVFVAQGHANEFTRKTAAERKAVLRNVLGLERYEDYALRAREYAKDTEADLKALRERIGEGLERLERLPEVKEEGLALAREEEEIRDLVAEARKVVAELQIAGAEFHRRAKDVSDAKSERLRIEASLLTAREALVQRELESARLTGVIEGGDAIRDEHAVLITLRGQEQRLGECQRRAQAHSVAVQEAEIEIARIASSLETEAATLRSAYEEAQLAADQVPALEESAKGLEAERDKLTEAESEISLLIARATVAKERSASEKTAAKAAREQAQEIKDRESQLDGVALCPVCRSRLDREQVEEIQEGYAVERKSLGDQYRQAIKEAELAKIAADADEKGAEALRSARESAEKLLRQKETDLATKLNGARTRAAGSSAIAERLTGIEESIAKATFAADARRALESAQGALSETGYDPAEHDRVREKLKAFTHAEARFRELESAGAKAEASKEMAGMAKADLEQLEEQLATIIASLKAAEIALAASGDVSEPLARADVDLAAVADRERTVLFKRGQAEKDRDTLLELEASLETAKDTESALAKEAALYGELGRAFGRDGVQAMLIDQALPRTELIANDLLDRMTGGRIQLQLATRRETKAGKVAETLDIRISDEVGQRDYEMFSGGEAFRIDFALRIALSQLLAERSGASLATLIIDEGFGSQDQEGLDRLVDALVSIKDRFRLVLVITHIEDLKQRFDRRIDVIKDPERGSAAMIV